jgi:uncharacterized protein with PIN domain
MPMLAGIKCPECRARMSIVKATPDEISYDHTTGVRSVAHPGQVYLHCSKCGHTGWIPVAWAKTQPTIKELLKAHGAGL